MCQLSLITVDDIDVARVLLTHLLIANSMDKHQDGTGILVKDVDNQPVLKKTEYAASHLINFYEFLTAEVVTTNPIIGHVRLASINKKVITTENAHPFYNDKSSITLAHNGTLVIDDEFVTKRYVKDTIDMIDSEQFLYILSQEYKANSEDMVKSLKSSMLKFTGKFAFMIYEGKTDKYYVVRGKTAKLFISEISSRVDDKLIGFVVNTEYNTLLEAIRYTRQITPLFGKSFDFTIPKLIDEETIFEVNIKENKLDVLDSIIENTKVVTPVVYTSGTVYRRSDYDYEDENWWNTRFPFKGGSNSNANPLTELDSIILKLNDFCEVYGFSIEELDYLMFLVFGTPMLGLTARDFTYFVKSKIPQIEERFESTPDNAKILRNWKRIKTRAIKYNPLELFSMYPDLKFPYFFTEFDVIHGIELDLRKELRKPEDVVVEGG